MPSQESTEAETRLTQVVQVTKEEARSFLNDADPKRNSEMCYLGLFYTLGCQCPWRGHVLRVLIPGIWEVMGLLSNWLWWKEVRTLEMTPYKGIMRPHPSPHCMSLIATMWLHYHVLHTWGYALPLSKHNGANRPWAKHPILWAKTSLPPFSVDYLKFVLQYWKADSRFVDTADLGAVKCNNVVCIWSQKF